MPTTDALRNLRLGDPVVETGESGMRGERGTVVASASRPGELAVLWHASERLPAGLQTGVTHGTLLDVDALRALAAKAAEERDEAQIEAADILEILGTMAWGIDLPPLFVLNPAFKPDGTVGSEPVVTALPREAAKQLVEAVYQRLAKGRGWLREARRELATAREAGREAGRQEERAAVVAMLDAERLRLRAAAEAFADDEGDVMDPEGQRRTLLQLSVVASLCLVIGEAGDLR